MTPPSHQEIITPVRPPRPPATRAKPARTLTPPPAPMLGRFHAGPRAGTSPCPPEVAFVFEDFGLIDAESYQRTYSRKGGQELARGYYVVTWPEGRGSRLFGDEAVFHGPYRDKKDAENSLLLFQTVLAAPLRGVLPWVALGPAPAAV